MPPVAGKTYLMQYDYQTNGVCAMSCFEQVPQTDGSFQNQRCAPALVPSE